MLSYKTPGVAAKYAATSGIFLFQIESIFVNVLNVWMVACYVCVRGVVCGCAGMPFFTDHFARKCVCVCVSVCVCVFVRNI